ncbi:hypothetical protein HPB52_008788 [Rhipicephalus sanguineus]|uniref:Major facilitator superfamily (MFS) profile domain-containing protein n=1 Tax=Rhipicephalus sanguineus TaxID=34632 RepID=A0A9D4SWT5_RHISA|nr:hypothetical protein HPB52_008788 [Rhipicephalus sanguineus]
MAANQTRKTGNVNQGPPNRAATPARIGAQNPELLQVQASPSAAEAKRRSIRGSLFPIAGAPPYAEARGPNASPAVVAPPQTKEPAPPGAARMAARGRLLEQPDPATARKRKRSSHPPAIVAIPIAELSPPGTLVPEIIATPSVTHGPLVIRTKKDEAKRERPSVGHRRCPSEVVAPLIPAFHRSARMGAPDDLRAMRQQSPPRLSSICLLPMNIGPGGTPELVAFPSSWRRRQSRLIPRAEFAGDAARVAPNDGRRASLPKEVYPVMDAAEDETPGGCPSTPQVTPPEKEDQQCGLLWFRPAFLRGFRTPGWVLLSLCSIEFTQGFVNSGVYSAVLPTIERRFNLSSFETGLLLSAFSVANCLFIVPVAFLGSTRNKPVIIASGIAIMSAGSFLFFLTYLIEPSYAYGTELPDLCYETPPALNQTTEACGKEMIRGARFLLILGSMMQGAGVTPLHTLGMSYLDENLPTRLTSLFVGGRRSFVHLSSYA